MLLFQNRFTCTKVNLMFITEIVTHYIAIQISKQCQFKLAYTKRQVLWMPKVFQHCMTALFIHCVKATPVTIRRIYIF